MTEDTGLEKFHNDLEVLLAEEDLDDLGKWYDLLVEEHIVEDHEPEKTSEWINQYIEAYLERCGNYAHLALGAVKKMEFLEKAKPILSKRKVEYNIDPFEFHVSHYNGLAKYFIELGDKAGNATAAVRYGIGILLDDYKKCYSTLLPKSKVAKAQKNYEVARKQGFQHYRISRMLTNAESHPLAGQVLYFPRDVISAFRSTDAHARSCILMSKVKEEAKVNLMINKGFDQRAILYVMSSIDALKTTAHEYVNR